MNRRASCALLGILAVVGLAMVGAADAACDTYGPIKWDRKGDALLAGYDITKLQACHDAAADEFTYFITVAETPALPLQGFWHVEIGFRYWAGFSAVAEVYGGAAGYEFRLLRHGYTSFGNHWSCDEPLEGSLTGRTFKVRIPGSMLERYFDHEIDRFSEYRGVTGLYLVPPVPIGPIPVCSHNRNSLLVGVSTVDPYQWGFPVSLDLDEGGRK